MNSSSSSIDGFGLRDALYAQALLDRVGRLRAVLEPMLRAILVDDDLGGLRLRVAAADGLDHAAVTRRALIGDGDAPDRILLAPHAGESNSYGHKRAASLARVVQMDRAVRESVLVHQLQIDAHAVR